MSRKKKQVVLRNLLVEDYAAEGKSIARTEGKVVFIENVVPGDTVDVFLRKNKKDWAEGSVQQFHSYSSDRVKPFCIHFGTCGGCQWQMLPYAKQLEYKQKQVEDQLSRIGGIPLPPVMPIIGASGDYTTRYRNKLEFTFANKRYLAREELGDESISSEMPSAGFHAKGVFDKVVNIIECHLMEPPANLIRETLRETAISLNMPFYDIRQHTGWMRNVVIRICTTGEIMVNVVLGYEDKAKRNQLLERLLKVVPEITSLFYTINAKWNDSLNDQEPVLYFGKPYAVEKLEQFEFILSPKSFFQTNTRQGENLYKVTRDFAELTGSQIVYDLYCGTGSIGIFVSQLAKKIIGVELVESAIEDANENARLNKISQASFFTGDVIDICNDDFFALHGRPDVIITDPPRAGMHEKLIQKILEMEAPLVVYVSCNPATQARDLRLLAEKYSIEKIQPVDMFPHTHHIENVVQLKLKPKPFIYLMPLNIKGEIGD
jgi:23S rRNA (uracil1939-C5)-methyltransferase